jgi:hypothetical protein
VRPLAGRELGPARLPAQREGVPAVRAGHVVLAEPGHRIRLELVPRLEGVPLASAHAQRLLRGRTLPQACPRTGGAVESRPRREEGTNRAQTPLGRLERSGARQRKHSGFGASSNGRTEDFESSISPRQAPEIRPLPLRTRATSATQATRSDRRGHKKGTSLLAVLEAREPAHRVDQVLLGEVPVDLLDHLD